MIVKTSINSGLATGITSSFEFGKTNDFSLKKGSLQTNRNIVNTSNFLIQDSPLNKRNMNAGLNSLEDLNNQDSKKKHNLRQSGSHNFQAASYYNTVNFLCASCKTPIFS